MGFFALQNLIGLLSTGSGSNHFIDQSKPLATLEKSQNVRKNQYDVRLILT